MAEGTGLIRKGRARGRRTERWSRQAKSSEGAREKKSGRATPQSRPKAGRKNNDPQGVIFSSGLAYFFSGDRERRARSDARGVRRSQATRHLISPKPEQPKKTNL